MGAAARGTARRRLFWLVQNVLRAVLQECLLAAFLREFVQEILHQGLREGHERFVAVPAAPVSKRSRAPLERCAVHAC